MHADCSLAPETRRRLLAGIAAKHFDDFSAWLRDRGYRPRSVQRRLQSLAAWTDWLTATGRDVQNLAEGLTACIIAVRVRPRRKYQFGPNAETVGATRLYLRFLHASGILPDEPVRSQIDAYPLLGEFRAWLLQHHGVAPATITAYLPVLLDLSGALGGMPEGYTAKIVRDFALQRARRYGSASAKMTYTAIRAFLRFLGVTKRLPPGMDQALPPVASWSNPTVPRYLPPADLEHLLASVPCSGNGLRDRAVLLLLGRLGLRAGDVVRLRLADIDFRAGILAVAGKGRRSELLPLPQDVGDALIGYLREVRPRVAVPEVFLTALPPPRPMTTQALAAIVARTLDRAGISAPTRGCHLLRHSAATSMLRGGASLAGVGAVLRHRRPATTVKYAKADNRCLLTVAQPWPGSAPC